MTAENLESVYFDLLDKLGTLESAASGQEFLRRAACLYGLDDVAYLGFDMPRLNNELYFLGTYQEPWVNHYRQNSFETLDPIVLHGFKSITPLVWCGDAYTGNRRVRKFFDEASDFGVGSRGLTFPIRGVCGERALFTVTSRENDGEWSKRSRRFMRDFQLLSFHLHQMVMRCEDAVLESIKLAPRERECLKWAAAGKSVADIAIILSLSDRAVRFYLDLARNKLNTMNITHSVARALTLKLI